MMFATSLPALPALRDCHLHAPLRIIRMNVVLFGIYKIGTEALTELQRRGVNIVCVVTKPDTTTERQPVSELAFQSYLPILAPTSIRRPEFLDRIRTVGPDLIVVSGFHRIFPKALLDIPRLGVINLHLSLLPKNRGPCPWKWVIVGGETVTGATVVQMNEGTDEGDIIFQKSLVVDEEDTGGTLFDRLVSLGVPMLADAMEDVLRGKAKRKPQNPALASHEPAPTSRDSYIPWNASAATIRNLIRGFHPRPGAWTICDGIPVVIKKSWVYADSPVTAPGTVLDAWNEMLLVGTGDGILAIQDLVPRNPIDTLPCIRPGATFGAGQSMKRMCANSELWTMEFIESHLPPTGAR
jgi:methionyl-tRNA formyltransferase